MNVFVIGSGKRVEELKKRIEKIEVSEDVTMAANSAKSGDVIIHFWESESIDDLTELIGMGDINIFINSINTTLSEIKVYTGEFSANVFGFAGIPGFIDRSKWDVTMTENSDLDRVNEFFKMMDVKPVVVQDRVGMVTPRVVSMIINEAYYTVMEGTAQKEDIDTAMKLGTNYPEGPFHWLEIIGIEHVYELLDAIYEDTREERYKICPLLKQEYLEIISN